MFVVMSDSHYDRDVVESIKSKYLNEATAIFHCGDSELPSSDEIWQGITVNPGSVAQPRGKYDIKMYAIIEIEGEEFKVSYRNLQHEPIPELQFRL